MPLACVYHPVEEMQVVTFEERERLIATGMWFKYPNEAKEMREHHEKQIRQQPEQRRSNAKRTSKSIPSGTQREQSVREESAE